MPAFTAAISRSWGSGRFGRSSMNDLIQIPLYPRQYFSSFPGIIWLDANPARCHSLPVEAIQPEKVPCNLTPITHRSNTGRSPLAIRPEGETKMPTKKELAVLVTTTHKGVFFGYAVDTSGVIIKLRAARNCIYWSSDVRGFIGLASDGPSKSCKIGPSANIELRDITCVAECSEKAVKAWEAAPWSS